METKVRWPLLILLFCACSTPNSRDTESSRSPAALKIPSPPTSEYHAHTKEALEELSNTPITSNTHHIVGSSGISRPLNHHRKTHFLYGAEHLKLDNYYFDIPIVYNAKVRKWMHYFLNRGRDFFERYGARAGRYAPLMGKILEDHGLPRDLIFLAMAESGFQNKAKSWAKAVGPWQFMPHTGRVYGLEINWYKDERRDPIKATIAAAKYLKKLYKDFGSWELAAAGYNAGEGKVSRAINRYRTENFWNLSRGRYLRRETKNYVPKIMALAIIGKNLRAFGFKDINFHEPLDFEEIEIEGMSDLFQIAEVLDMDFKELQRLNPEILRWFTPPNESYKLRVPVGAKVVWNKCCRKEADNFVAKDFMEYQVRGKRTRLSHIARKFRIKRRFIDVLSLLNPEFSVNSRLKKGQTVLLPFKKGQNLRNNMYADLYERPRRSVLRRRRYGRRIRLAMRRGQKIKSPKEYYTVKRGDSLWTVARKHRLSLDTLIVSNLKIVRKRRIRAGDRLIIR